MIQIVRYDRRPEPRADVIAADWQAWLRRAGYILFSSAEVHAAGLALQLDVYERDTPGIDQYALYHPEFRPGSLRATLYLLPNATAMDEMLQRAQQMVATMMTAAAHRSVANDSAASDPQLGSSVDGLD